MTVGRQMNGPSLHHRHTPVPKSIGDGDEPKTTSHGTTTYGTSQQQQSGDVADATVAPLTTTSDVTTGRWTDGRGDDGGGGEAPSSAIPRTSEDPTESSAPLASTTGTTCLILCAPCNRFYGGNNDAIGFCLDSAPRGIIVIGGLFLVTALLRLAKQAAGCPVENSPEEPECMHTVHGMRPSSLITTVQAVASFLVALLLPLVGAVIDHTRHRRLVGQVSAAMLVCFSVVPIFISEETWYGILILQVFVVFVYAVHSTASFAYFPELTDDEGTLVRYSSSFTASIYAAMILVLILVVGLTTALGITDDDVATTRLSQSIVLALLVVFFGAAWTFFFSEKPAYSAVPDDDTLLTSGFKKIFTTAKKIRRDYPAIKWCLVGIAFSNAAVATLVTVAVTFMTEVLDFTATQNGITLLVMLLASFPGSVACTYVTRLINPLRSLQLCLLIWTTVTALAAVVLRGPGQQGAAYLFAIGWGVAAGWFDPTERALYVKIIPKNQDAELMGVYLCACQIIGWLPPLIFTAMNEAGVSMRIGLGSLCFYFLLTFLIYFLMGDYHKAVEQAKSGQMEAEPIALDPSDLHLQIETQEEGMT